MTKPPTQIANVRVNAAGRKLHGHAVKHGDIELQPVRKSAAVGAAYDAALQQVVGRMHGNVKREVLRTYAGSMGIAMDATPAQQLRAALRKLSRKWLARFEELAPKLAEYFATDASARVDGELKRMLREAGFTVRFKLSIAQRNAVQAVVAENVALIKSIPVQYLTNVEGAVMRSVTRGRDAGALATELEENYGVTRRRARNIARSQNEMATAVFTKLRQTELGIRKARWLHSAGGKVPRPEHVAFSGKTYDVEKGAFLEGKWTWPGLEINCGCASIPIIPGT